MNYDADQRRVLRYLANHHLTRRHLQEFVERDQILKDCELDADRYENAMAKLRADRLAREDNGGHIVYPTDKLAEAAQQLDKPQPRDHVNESIERLKSKRFIAAMIILGMVFTWLLNVAANIKTLAP